MTSVSHRQAASYNASYEMSPKPASIRREDSAEAQVHSARHSDSATPRPPVTAEQRGQFSAHGHLVNPPSSTTGADSARLAQLSQQNAQLRDGIQNVIDHFTPIIMQLRQQVAELTRQANGAGSPGEQPAAPSEQGVRGGPEHRESPDEPAAAAENAQVSGDFQQMVAENNQLRETVERLQAQFTMVVTQLQKQIQALSQKLGGPDVEADQAPARTSGADASSNASPDRAADEEPRDASPAQSDEAASSTSRTVDDLMRDNQQLRAQLEQMVAQFTQVISQLKQQIEQLSAQVKARTA